MTNDSRADVGLSRTLSTTLDTHHDLRCLLWTDFGPIERHQLHRHSCTDVTPISPELPFTFVIPRPTCSSQYKVILDPCFVTTHTLPLPSASPSPPTPSHSPLPLPHHPHPPTPLCLSLSTHTLPLLSAFPFITIGIVRAGGCAFQANTPPHSLCFLSIVMQYVRVTLTPSHCHRVVEVNESKG
ncbi:hypothetical protein BLNAU_11982 [Blattamonas nauphoetae]|uniref:Uncharacterized protein n=1 Tax=Blattamonas nauphoetae TaxID=2049346 RepID=A0ABQ9XKP3_9EUKA|nr:hypothetical protein BLNAU_11982 [Blattamonas nauphoetae]